MSLGQMSVGRMVFYQKDVDSNSELSALPTVLPPLAKKILEINISYEVRLSFECRNFSACLPIRVSACLLVHLSAVRLHTCLPACLSACLSACPSICPFVCLSIHSSVCLSIHLSVYPFICLSVHSSVCLHVNLDPL
jgi:hypothetical protein